MNETKEHFGNSRVDCFSRKNFRITSETDKLYRTSAQIKEHVLSIKSRLKNVDMYSHSDNYYLEIHGKCVGVIGGIDFDQNSGRAYVGDSYLFGEIDDHFIYNGYKEFIDTSEDFRGQGYGTVLYVKAGIMSALNGYSLSSDGMCSREAKRVWNSLTASKITDYNKGTGFTIDNEKLLRYFT